MSPVQDSQPAPEQPPRAPEPGTPRDDSGLQDDPGVPGQPTAESGQSDVADRATTESAPPLPAAPQGSPSAGLVAVGILIGLCLIGGLLVMMVRRRILRGDSDDAATVSLMDSLRGMLRNGEITQGEFDAAKRSMVTGLAAKAGTGPTPKVQREAR